MATRLEIVNTVPDSRAQVRKKKLHALGFNQVTDIQVIDVYTIDKKFSKHQLQQIGDALRNPVTQKFVIRSTNKPSPPPSPKKGEGDQGKSLFTVAVEVGFLPGVTDNIAHTAREIIEDLLKVKFAQNEGVYTSQFTLLSGNILEKDAKEIAQSMYNPLIQRMHLKSFKDFKKDGGMDTIVPVVKLQQKAGVTQVSLDIPAEGLQQLGKLGIANKDGIRRGPLALDLQSLHAIAAYFKKKKRNPTDIELESIAQTWSEHCKHTIFANPLDDIKDGLYKTYIKRATELIRKRKGKNDFCVSVFTDNSGAIEFDSDYLITHKVETHNSPSALDPFGGAITGIVGVNRDAIGFGLGAKPVANFYGFCFADPRKNISLFKDKDHTQQMLSSRRIMDGVVEGVNAGGNQSGIPTPQGFVYFDESYRGKPLVFVGTVGLIPKKVKDKKSWKKKANSGDYIVMIGGRVGKDGIHGATFSSEALSSGSPVGAVQIGDPITQKKLSDVLVKEARDQLLYSSITDNGAGGLSCSVAEMAKESGGCTVDLEKVPLKYPGLQPWEIWISESQERMTLSVPKRRWKSLSSLLKKRGVEATIIGEFTKSGKCIVRYKGATIMDIDMEFLHDGLPKKQMISKKPASHSHPRGEINYASIHTSGVGLHAKWKEPVDHNKILLSMLSRPNITSYSFISQQYDSVVQAESVLPPLQGRGRVNADVSVFRPVLSSQKGVILSQALYPTYSEIDPYNMAASCIDTAIRNAVASGANPNCLALLDNFCWCSSTQPERLWQLKEAARACFDTATAFGTPFISGKDSMFNDFNGYDKKGNPIKISVLPTLLISSIGVISDITKIVSLDTKMPADCVYLLGETLDELGGSEFFAMQREEVGTNLPSRAQDRWNKEVSIGKVPAVDAKKNKKLYEALYKALCQNLVASSISVGRGGLGVALSRMAIGGQLGLDVSLRQVASSAKRNDIAFYSESQGRILVTVAPQYTKKFEQIMKGNVFMQLGTVTGDNKFVIKDVSGKKMIDISVNTLTNAYTKTFRDY